MLIIVLLSFCSTLSLSQTFEDYLRKNAVEVNFSDTLSSLKNNTVFTQYDLFMIGEMHGTCEPVNLLGYLTEQLLMNGKKIKVGLEIPADLLSKFIKEPNKENLRSSRFFNNIYEDGKASLEWRSLIEKFNGNPNVKFFFYDTPDSVASRRLNADSIMYENVKKELVTSAAGQVTLLLGGNIHNRITLFRGMKTMGYYLINDAKIGSKKICSINHEYKSGAMRNNMGNGLKVNVIRTRETIFSTSTSFTTYFCALPVIEGYPYTGIFYTERITPSTPIK